MLRRFKKLLFGLMVTAVSFATVAKYSNAMAQGTFLRDYAAGKALDYAVEKHNQATKNLGYNPFYPPVPGPAKDNYHRPLTPDEIEKAQPKGRTG